MKSHLLKILLQSVFLLSLSDLLLRYLTDKSQFIKSWTHLDHFYEKQRPINSALENAVYGTMGILVFLIFSKCSLSSSMKIRCDNGFLFVISIVFGFYLGFLDKHVFRKELYTEYNHEINSVWGSSLSSLYYMGIVLCIISLNTV